MSNRTLITRIDDWMNPIAIKEMRQAVKGNFISWILMLFMLVQLTIIGVVLLFNDSLGSDFNVGRGLFLGLLGVLMGVCMLFLPALAALRMVSERSDKNVDLLFITTLRPYQIILGKMAVSLILTLLFFSASLPFMTLTYLLRGLDLPTMFIMMALDFLVVAAGIQLGVMMASFPGGIIRKGICLLIGLGCLFMMFVLAVQATAGMLFFGLGGSIGTWRFWGPALTVVIFLLMGIGGMYVLSVAAITPRSANKAFLPRLYIFAAWILSGIVAFCWAFKGREEEIVVAWMAGSILILCINLFVAICEREEFGPRLRKTIPENVLLRPVHFLFSSGSAAGILYTLILMVLTIGCGFTFIAFGMRNSNFDFDYLIVIAFVTYALGYCLLGHLIKRKLFPNSQKTGLAAIITAFLGCAGTVIPAVIGFMLKDNPRALVDEIWYTGSPFVLFYEEKLIAGCLFSSLAVSVILLAVSLPWFRRQYSKFKPLPKLVLDENQGEFTVMSSEEIQSAVVSASVSAQQANASLDEAGDE